MVSLPFVKVNFMDSVCVLKLGNNSLMLLLWHSALHAFPMSP